MLLSFFRAAFTLFTGNVFPDAVYEQAGMWLLLFSVLCVFLYYYVLNSFWARYSRAWPHWGIMMLLCMLFNVVALILIEHDAMLSLFDATSVFLVLVDAVYAAIFYFLFSILLKWLSPHASRTPF